MPSIKGTASVADERARNKALKATKFSRVFKKAVNINKINRAVLTQWIEQKVAIILGFDDEIVSQMAINLFLPSNGETPDPKRSQLDLAGFLGEDESATFSKELWTLMVEASESSSGIPQTLLEAKKKELAAQKAAAAAAAAAQPRADVGRLPQLQHPAAAVGQPQGLPDMDDYIQEAARRAERARQAIGMGMAAAGAAAGIGNNHPNGNRADGAPIRIPASPPHMGSALHQDDRKPPPPPQETMNVAHAAAASDSVAGPTVDQFGRAIPPASLQVKSAKRDSPTPNECGRRSSTDRRSRSRDGNRGSSRRRYVDRDRHHHHRRRDDDRSRHSGERRRRYGDDTGYRSRSSGHDRRPFRDDYRSSRGRDAYDNDREVYDLERRLASLKREYSSRTEDRRLGGEIQDIKDRLYKLERRRRKYESRSRRREDNSEHDSGSDEEYRQRRRKGRRSRSRSRTRSRSDSGSRSESSKSAQDDDQGNASDSGGDNLPAQPLKGSGDRSDSDDEQSRSSSQSRRGSRHDSNDDKEDNSDGDESPKRKRARSESASDE